jgi:hypothetical protein
MLWPDNTFLAVAGAPAAMAKATTALKILNFICCFLPFLRERQLRPRERIRTEDLWPASDIPFKPGNALRERSAGRAR